MYDREGEDVPIIPYDDIDSDMVDEQGGPSDEFVDAAAAAGFDSLSAVVIALLLIGAGVLFLIAQINAENNVEDPFIGYQNLHWWLAIGAGIILFTEVLVRLFMPRFRAHLAGRLILVFLFLAIGVAGKIGLGFAIPVVLIGLGLIVLVAWFFR